MDTWLYLNSGPGQPALNMAWDEALLEEIARIGFPVLRTYSWAQPAATFGYFQKYDDVARFTAVRPLLRRPTGGGLVPHENDWTYSVVIPPGHPWYRTRAADSYQRLHRWLQTAFGLCGVATELVLERDPAGPGECFVGAEPDDLLWHGRKIAGAAQRRNRRGLLIQGSVQPPPAGITRAVWEKALLESLNRVEVKALVPDTDLEACVQRLASERYSRAEYHRKK
ncbi:MAG TPA: lipoate--protein ligase family protein [Verrucomicrobiota bacterium]|nr:lipoate--protein ligase family protein [Verrucomicrobiota bacterium]